MNKGITLITMGAGNVFVLEETLKSFRPYCNEIIYGDLLLFQEDREVVCVYEKKYNIKSIKLPFDYIFKNGFSSILNLLASYATNDLVIYMNTSEIIEQDFGIEKSISDEYNCYYFDHATDKNRWFRFYNRYELEWSGRIHESITPKKGFDFRPFHKPVFRMADLEKDMHNPFKAAIFNSVKEIVYFTNYMSIIDNPDNLGATDPGWIQFAKDNYDYWKKKLESKGDGYKAFVNGDYYALMKYIYETNYFEKERYESNIGIEYQGDPKYLGKK